MSYIFEKGVQFEKYIVNKIKIMCKKNNLLFKRIVEGCPDYNKYDQYLLDTKNAFANKYDVIYQGMIQSPEKSEYKFRGFPDLIISKKAFKLLFFNFIDKQNNYNVILEADFNKDINNYIIIDIKSSTIQINADGRTARNTGLLKY